MIIAMRQAALGRRARARAGQEMEVAARGRQAMASEPMESASELAREQASMIFVGTPDCVENTIGEREDPSGVSSQRDLAAQPVIS